VLVNFHELSIGYLKASVFSATGASISNGAQRPALSVL
jgi:hypothetical protein